MEQIFSGKNFFENLGQPFQCSRKVKISVFSKILVFHSKASSRTVLQSPRVSHLLFGSKGEKITTSNTKEPFLAWSHLYGSDFSAWSTKLQPVRVFRFHHWTRANWKWNRDHRNRLLREFLKHPPFWTCTISGIKTPGIKTDHVTTENKRVPFVSEKSNRKFLLNGKHPKLKSDFVDLSSQCSCTCRSKVARHLMSTKTKCESKEHYKRVFKHVYVLYVYFQPTTHKRILL